MTDGEQLAADLAAARATIARLNRRAQEAESAMADLLRCNAKLASGAAWCGGSLGRKFLAYANHRLREQLVAAGITPDTRVPAALG